MTERPPESVVERPTIAAALRLATSVAPGTGAYTDLFHKALAAHAIDMVGVCKVNDQWLRENAHRIDIIHLHWPETFWRHDRGKLGGLLRGVGGFWGFLRLARRLGLKIVWTVHNLEHHEGASWADRLGYRILAKSADILICHSNWERDQVVARWRPPGQVVVMRYGNTIGYYPRPRSRGEVLREMGLDDRLPTLCCMGGIRPYKGLERAIDAVKSLGGGYQLVIAGPPLEDCDALKPLLEMTAGVPYIVVRAQWVSDQSLSDILGASDAALFSYHSITGSFAFMTAMSFGRGVIAADLPFFRESLSGYPDAGRLCAAADSAAFAAGIREYLSVPADRRTASARALADAYSWADVILPVAKAIRDRAGGRSSGGAG